MQPLISEFCYLINSLVVNGMAHSGTMTRSCGAKNVNISFHGFNTMLHWSGNMFFSTVPRNALSIRTKEAFVTLDVLSHFQTSSLNAKFMGKDHYYEKQNGKNDLGHCQRVEFISLVFCFTKH